MRDLPGLPFTRRRLRFACSCGEARLASRSIERTLELVLVASCGLIIADFLGSGLLSDALVVKLRARPGSQSQNAFLAPKRHRPNVTRVVGSGNRGGAPEWMRRR